MKRRGITYVLIGIGIVMGLMASCSGEVEKRKPLDLADMDQSIDPGDDFYRYANGGWLDRTTIPEDRVRYGTFEIIQEENEMILLDILTRAMERKGDTLDAEWLKIGDFFASGLDTTSIEAMGLSPIAPDLEFISNIMTPQDIVREIARERSIGGSNPFYVSVEQDIRDATTLRLSFYQTGLGMPERDYYFNPSAHSEQLRAAYKEMLRRVFALLGHEEDRATSMASDVFALESKLAEASLSRLEYRDPHLTYNKLTIPELKKLTPNIDWDLYFQNLGIDAPEVVLLDNPRFFSTISNLLNDTEINVWKDYLAVHYVLAYSSNLIKELEDISFAFYGKALSGQEVQQPRWKRVMRACQSALGEAVGKVYVKENFPPEAKERMLTLVENLRSAFRERIANLTWMSKETKKKAQEKLDAIVVKIGYPEKWKDYTDLAISRDCYATNVRNAHTFRFQETMSKLYKPLDRTEWFMNPQTVNAYYNPPMNEIVFPAGILQPPFFNMEADDAVNYGAIGVVIAHEITHGFDDQGRKFNKDGNLENWWTAEDSARFTEYSQLIIDQFDDFNVINGIHINGKLTLGENIADYGGMTIAMHALKKVLAEQESAGTPAQPIDGFDPLQRFFLSYAKIWRNKIRDQELIRRLNDDVHAPGQYRVLGSAYNIDEFYQAFSVKQSSPYYRSPEQRPTIW